MSTDKQMIQDIPSVRAYMQDYCNFDIEESLSLPRTQEFLKDSWLEPQLRVYHSFSFVRPANENTPPEATLFRVSHAAAKLVENWKDRKIVAVPLGAEGAKEIVFLTLEEAEFFELPEINIKGDPETGAVTIAEIDIKGYDLVGYKAH